MQTYFQSQMETIVTQCLLSWLQVFFATHVVLKNWGVFSEIFQFYLGNIRSRDAFRLVACERKYLMDI